MRCIAASSYGHYHSTRAAFNRGFGNADPIAFGPWRNPGNAKMNDHLTATAVRERGWTNSMIKRFLGEPDRTAYNPYGRGGEPRIKLFLTARVEAAESQAEFAAAQLKAMARSRASQRAADTKSATLLRLVEQIEITVRVLPLAELYEHACAHFNCAPRRERDGSYASVKALTAPTATAEDCAFLARITRNFIRHELTGYDSHINALYKQVGRKQAYQLLRTRVEAEISKVYAALATISLPAHALG